MRLYVLVITMNWIRDPDKPSVMSHTCFLKSCLGGLDGAILTDFTQLQLFQKRTEQKSPETDWSMPIWPQSRQTDYFTLATLMLSYAAKKCYFIFMLIKSVHHFTSQMPFETNTAGSWNYDFPSSHQAQRWALQCSANRPGLTGPDWRSLELCLVPVEAQTNVGSCRLSG